MGTPDIAELQRQLDQERSARQRAEQALRILATNAEVHQHRDLRELLQGILELAGEHILIDEACVLLYDPASRVLDTVAAIGRNAEKSKQQQFSIDQGRGTVRDVFNKKLPVRIDNVRTDREWWERQLEGSTLVRPLSQRVRKELGSNRLNCTIYLPARQPNFCFCPVVPGQKLATSIY